jgi:hypothetical protein
LKEQLHVLGRKVINPELLDRFVEVAGNKREQQHKRVAVAALSITGQIALTHQVFQQKASDPRAKLGGISHGASPQKHTVESVAMLPGATRVSSLGKLGWQRG